MLYFRACPRCHTGTVELESDTHGPYLSCLNCGFQKAGDTLRKFAARRTTMVSGSARAVPVYNLPADASSGRSDMPQKAAVNS